LRDWEEELGKTEMFYLVEGGGRRMVIYSLGQELALSTGRTVSGRENNLCRARLEDSSSASHPCHYDPMITRAVVQLRRTGHALDKLPQAQNLSAKD